MFTGTRQRVASFEGTRPRAGAGWLAGLAAVLAAWLVAAAPVSAKPPPAGATVFVHSATSGELRGGRLILHGVAGRVSWVHNSGRAGVLAVKPLHRRLFSPATSASGTLHVAGHRGGDEPAFRLSRPHYNAARHTVSYKAKPLNNKRLPDSAASAAQAARRFGAASLTIVPGTPPPGALDVDDSFYYCDGASTGPICWAVLSGDNLRKDAPITVTRHWSDGRPDDTVMLHADEFGFVSAMLNLRCPRDDEAGVTSVDIESIGANFGDPSISKSAPEGCRTFVPPIAVAR